MPQTYQINGSVTLRECEESEEIIDDLRRYFDADGAVDTETLHEEITLSLNGSSDSAYVAEEMPGLIGRMKPLGAGVGFFNCESEHERWIEYIGDPERCRELESAEALLDISARLPQLTASDHERLIELSQLSAGLAKVREDVKARVARARSRS